MNPFCNHGITLQIRMNDNFEVLSDLVSWLSMIHDIKCEFLSNFISSNSFSRPILYNLRIADNTESE